MSSTQETFRLRQVLDQSRLATWPCGVKSGRFFSQRICWLMNGLPPLFPNQDRSVLVYPLLHSWFRGKGDFLSILFSYSDFRLPMATFARQSSFEYLIEQIALLSRWFRGYSTLKRGRVFTVNGVLNASWNMVNLLSLSEMTTKELNITLAIFILSESWGRVYLSFNT